MDSGSNPSSAVDFELWASSRLRDAKCFLRYKTEIITPALSTFLGGLGKTENSHTVLSTGTKRRS